MINGKTNNFLESALSSETFGNPVNQELNKLTNTYNKTLILTCLIETFGAAVFDGSFAITAASASFFNICLSITLNASRAVLN